MSKKFELRTIIAGTILLAITAILGILTWNTTTFFLVAALGLGSGLGCLIGAWVSWSFRRSNA